MIPDGRVGDSGEILEIEPPRRLVLTWRNEFKPELRAEGYSRLTYELEKQGESVKLTLFMRSTNPIRSSSRRFRADGHISLQASRVSLKQESRSKEPAAGPKLFE